MSISPPKTAKIDAVVLNNPTLRLAIIKSDGVSLLPARQPIKSTARKYNPMSMKFRIIRYSKMVSARTRKRLRRPPLGGTQETFSFPYSEKNWRGGAEKSKCKEKVSCARAERARRRGNHPLPCSKLVRALSIIGHQTGFCKFLEVDREVCSPRLAARLARKLAA